MEISDHRPVSSEHEKDLERLSNFRLMDDDFMFIFFDENIEGTELVLDIILERDDLIVAEVKGQYVIKNVYGREVRLDIYAKDRNSIMYDIEVQRADKNDDFERAEFNSCLLGTKTLKEGQDYKKVAESYVIFITETDVIGNGLPIYHIDRHIRETKVLFPSKNHEIFVNGAYQNDEDAIGRLMHDFRCTNASDMNYNVLADRTRYLKETEGGRQQMCKAMEDMRREAAEKDAVAAEHKKAVEVALLMLEDDVEHQIISKYSGLSLEEIDKLDSNRKKSA